MRILIVEDEVIIAKDLADIVRANGFEAISANFFEEAIQAIQTFKPHIIFCDIDLGGAIDRDGVALVQMV